MADDREKTGFENIDMSLKAYVPFLVIVAILGAIGGVIWLLAT